MGVPALRLRAMFFDLDGTCVNSDHIHYETYRDTLLALAPAFNNGIPISRDLYDSTMSGRQNPELVAAILPHLSRPEQKRIWMDKEARYEKVVEKGVPPVHGLSQLLALCAEKMLLSYVVTNAPRKSALVTLNAIGLYEHFQQRVVVAEDCPRPKPAPDPYIKALAQAHLSKEHVLVFEDSVAGVTSAVRAGLTVVGVRSTMTDQVLRNAGALFTIADYTDTRLADALQQWIK